MKTLLNTTVNPDVMQGVLYLCDYDGEKLTVTHELIYSEAWVALEAYANIPNPASQLAVKTKTSSLEEELEKLHTRMNDTEWQKQLSDYL